MAVVGPTRVPAHPLCWKPMSSLPLFSLSNSVKLHCFPAERMCRDSCGPHGCQVDTFCCGCADLRKGALIIGSVNLVRTMMMMMMMMMIHQIMMMMKNHHQIRMMMMMISYLQVIALIQFAYNGWLLVNLLLRPQVNSSDTEICKTFTSSSDKFFNQRFKS